MSVVTRENYFDSAMTILAEHGARSLKVGALARRHGVTIGSFYHHFGNYESFVSELLAFWEREQTERIITLAIASDDPMARVQRMKELALTLPHDAEAAIRAWAATNPKVREVQQRVDAERAKALGSVIHGVVGNRSQARRLAVMGMSLLVGLQQWRSPVERRELARLLDDFETLVLSYTVPA